MTALPEPAVGQVWRNRASGRLVRIEWITAGHVGARAIEWMGLSGRGPRVGGTWEYTWTSRYTFLANSEAEL